MEKIYKLDIYTTGGVLTFDVSATVEGFKDDLIDALGQGAAVVTTTDNTQLVLNANNIVAIEIAEEKEEENVNYTPPM